MPSRYFAMNLEPIDRAAPGGNGGAESDQLCRLLSLLGEERRLLALRNRLGLDSAAFAQRLLEASEICGFRIIEESHLGGVIELGRWSPPASWLQRDLILQSLSAQALAHLASIEVCCRLNSTQEAAQQLADDSGGVAVVLAEYQQSGRGRRGRRWFSPPGAGVTLSLACRVGDARELDGLSLAIAVWVRRALIDAGVASSRLELKWPNDLLLDRRKLGGILVESKSRGRDLLLVVGIGINADLAQAGQEAEIGRPYSDLRQALGVSVERNLIVTRLLERLLPALADYRRGQLAALLSEWRGCDAYRDQEVELLHPDGRRLVGIARGVDERGALRLQRGGVIAEWAIGEVTLRLSAANTAA